MPSQYHSAAKGVTVSHRKFPTRHELCGPVFLFTVAICASLASFFALGSWKSRQSQTLVIKLHNSEQQFVEQALHEIVLVPDKLDGGGREEELSLEEECKALRKQDDQFCSCSQMKANCKAILKQALSHRSSNCKDENQQPENPDPASANGGREDGGAGSLDKKASKVAAVLDRPVQGVVAARKLSWLKNTRLKQLRQRMARNAALRKSLDVMKVTMPSRLTGYKNPCFLDAPRPLTQCHSGAFNSLTKQLTGLNKVQSRPLASDQRLYCLPYFILAGMPQSGASELMRILGRHPDVLLPDPVDTEWLERVRFDENCDSVNAYIDYFLPQANILNSTVGRQGTRIKVIGELAENLLWDNGRWPVLPGNEKQFEPRFTNADYLYHLNPEVKVIVIFRDPAERLYEAYIEDADRLKFEATHEDFDKRVRTTLERLRTCMLQEPLRTCLYDTLQDSKETSVRVELGLYDTLLQDWLRVFPRSQLHVVHFDRLGKHTGQQVFRVLNFLQLRRPSKAEMTYMLEEPREQDGVEGADGDERAMLSATKSILDKFYTSHSRMLATLLEDEGFMFSK